MPTSGPRQATRDRAELAWRLRVRGRTWQECADETGYRSRQSVIKAVQSFLRRTPPDDVKILRLAMGEGLAWLQVQLFDSIEIAQAKRDVRGVAQLAQVAADTIDKQARLYGLHIAVPTEVNVTLTAQAALAEARARLADAIDVEVVELPAVSA